MKRLVLALTIIAMTTVNTAVMAQDSVIAVACGAEFVPQSGTFSGTELPYRKASLGNAADGKAALVMYLHGGTSKGSDNAAQMNEPGIDSIARYIMSNGIHATFIVPQCPKDKSWGGAMNAVLKGLLDRFALSDTTDTDRIYIFGGSMGGTGTWGMVSSYPDLFAAAMPVAGDPSKCSAASVAHTPVFTVMGTADAIMKISNVQTFTDQLSELGGEYMFETEEGWTHETTCIESYNARRLDWVFGHKKSTNPSAGVDAAPVSDEIKDVKYYTMGGMEVAKPASGGAYVERTVHADGRIAVRKLFLRTR